MEYFFKERWNVAKERSLRKVRYDYIKKEAADEKTSQKPESSKSSLGSKLVERTKMLFEDENTRKERDEKTKATEAFISEYMILKKVQYFLSTPLERLHSYSA